MSKLKERIEEISNMKIEAERRFALQMLAIIEENGLTYDSVMEEIKNEQETTETKEENNMGSAETR